ncbi:MAG: hypothetical protein ACYC9O_16780, partial [Candidatus Latescibacterota bacterium]
MTIRAMSIGLETLLNGSTPPKGNGDGSAFAAILCTFLAGEWKGEAAVSEVVMDGQLVPENSSSRQPLLRIGTGENSLLPETEGEEPAEVIVVATGSILSDETTNVVLNIPVSAGDSRPLPAALAPDMDRATRLVKTIDGRQWAEIPVGLTVDMPQEQAGPGEGMQPGREKAQSNCSLRIEALLVLPDSPSEEESKAEAVLALTFDQESAFAREAVRFLFPGIMVHEPGTGESNLSFPRESTNRVSGESIEMAVSTIAAPQTDFAADESRTGEAGAENHKTVQAETGPAPEKGQPHKETLSEKVVPARSGDLFPGVSGAETKQADSSPAAGGRAQ